MTYDNKRTGDFFELVVIQDEGELLFEKGLFRYIWSKTSSGIVDKGNYTSAFPENHIFFCTPYHNKVVNKGGGELYVLSFSHEFLRNAMVNEEFFRIYPIFLSLDFDNAVSLDKKMTKDINYVIDKIMDEMLDDRVHKITHVKALFSQLLVYYQRILLASNKLVQSKSKSGNSLVEQFYLKVEDSYKAKHKVQEYAEMFGTTTTALSNVFRDFPLSPIKIIHQRIHLEAKRLLTYSSLSIKQISYVLGFQETPHFYHFFKKKEGCTPKEFRNRIK